MLKTKKSPIETDQENSENSEMKIIDGLITAAEALKTNRPRSLLSILGIVIGITSVMLVMSLGSGAKKIILGELQGIGSKIIIIHPGRQPRGISDITQTMSDSLKERDLAELKRKSNVPHATKVEVLNVGGAMVLYGNEKFQSSAFGASELLQSFYQVDLSEGRFISDDDVKGMLDVAVIGSKVRDELFGPGASVLGERIRIKEKTFRIIGIVAPKGQVSFVNLDEAVILPYTTAQKYVFGIKYFNHILVEVDSEENIDETITDIERTLRGLHNIDNPEKDDFNIVTQKSAMARVETVTSALTLFIGLVAAISLIVGGIGIMNIMLVAVTERTKEIGLRKAVGATEGDILEQFLLESAMLTGLGGIVGVITGVIASWATSFLLQRFAVLNWPFEFSFLSVILGLGVSTIIGIVFGIYPARTAAIKEPIESLRYE